MVAVAHGVMMAAQFRFALASDTYAGDTLHAGRAGKRKCTASRRCTQQIFFREMRKGEKVKNRWPAEALPSGKYGAKN
jgi:hypothetical protein